MTSGLRADERGGSPADRKVAPAIPVPPSGWAGHRRAFLGAVAGGALAAGMPGHAAAGTEQAVPFSAGTAPPRLTVPPLACDSHIHIFSKRFPASPHWRGQPVEDSDVAAYRLFQQRIGTSRTVVVTPSTYGIDNRATLDGVAQLGQAAARAVVVVDTDIPDADLRAMAGQGAVGIRVNFVTPQSWGTTTVERLETMARKIAPLGWHVQIYATADQILAMEGALAALPTPLVIDHLGRLPPEAGTDHPGHAAILRLLARGRTWIKLSGAYLNTKIGPPAYPDATAVARSYVRAAPERMVWGSDWPHRGEKELPDDAALIDLLETWAPSAENRQRILVANPERLYGFPPS